MDLLVLNNAETIQRSLINTGKFEPHNYGVAIDLLQNCQIEGDVIDVGASLGAFSIPVAKWIKTDLINRRIHAFEAQRDVYFHLCANLLINQVSDQILPHLLPLAEQVVVVKIPNLNVYKERFTGSVSLSPEVINKRSDMKQIAEPANHTEEFTVMSTSTLDKEFINTKIALLKIDVEGMEKEVILGGIETIRRDRPYILAESWGLEEFSGLRDELLTVLNTLSYSLFLNQDDIVAIPREKLDDRVIQVCERNGFVNNTKNPISINVIMPSYCGDYENSASDRETKLVRAIDSFFNQSYRYSELIIIADGCKTTSQVVDAYLQKKPNLAYRLQLIEIDKQDLFSGVVRNAGLQKSHADIICYLDSDDQFINQHLQNIALGFQDDEECDWVYFNDYEAVTENFSKIRQRNCQITERENRKTLFNLIGTSVIAHRRDDALLWSDGYAHDNRFVRDLLECKPNWKKIEGGGYLICHVPYHMDF